MQRACARGAAALGFVTVAVDNIFYSRVTILLIYYTLHAVVRHAFIVICYYDFALLATSIVFAGCRETSIGPARNNGRDAEARAPQLGRGPLITDAGASSVLYIFYCTGTIVIISGHVTQEYAQKNGSIHNFKI